MPTTTTQMMCDHPGCAGRLEEFARSKPWCSSLPGSVKKYSIFYQCGLCQAIYYGQESFCTPYTGPLTLAQLSEHIPNSIGLWSSWDDDAVVLEATLRETRQVTFKARLQQDTIVLPGYLVRACRDLTGVNAMDVEVSIKLEAPKDNA